MGLYTIALFGESERGEFQSPYQFTSLDQLVEALGNPPPNTRGLHFAIQALLFERRLIFFRVREEGFSTPDYLLGLRYLKERPSNFSISAICLPGVGDNEIIDASRPICEVRKSLLIVNESDLFDYLTSGDPQKEH